MLGVERNLSAMPLRGRVRVPYLEILKLCVSAICSIHGEI